MDRSTSSHAGILCGVPALIVIALRYTEKQVEVWYQGNKIALHVRRYKKGAHSTLPEHMPKSHRKHMEWTPGRFLNWATQIGLATTRLVKHLLECERHLEQGYRSCLGLLNLSKRFGDERLEKVCDRAWQLGSKTRRSVESILRHHLDEKPLHQENKSSVSFEDHENY